MAKKVIQLTESELLEMIKDVTIKNLNEMDGKTYARIYNATKRAKEDNQLGTYQRTVGSKTTNNDAIIQRATNMEKAVQRHWLKDFIGQTFMFYGQDRMGLVAHVLFTFDEVAKLDVNKTILVGTVTFNQTQISGDGIVVNFENGTIKYHERGSRYAYNLEVDNRTSPLWNRLMEQLQMALSHRV